MRFHLCPAHGWERCIMTEDGHGCARGAPLVGWWPTRTRDWVVVG